MSETICVTITRQEEFRLLVDFGESIPKAIADEPPPLGDDAGPSAERPLAAAGANCLCGNLLFAITKFKGRSRTHARDGDLRDPPQRE